MRTYYINIHANENGYHEVHIQTCQLLPNSEHRKSIGKFRSCNEAIIEAEKYYPQSKGCSYCCNR